jgi:phosphohistidine phosphatase SixA
MRYKKYFKQPSKKKLIATTGLLIAVLINSVGLSHADGLWDALKSGNHLVLMRHALAPGYGDPANFDVKECRTQRNLNEVGRQQSIDIGDLFRSNGIDKAIVLSSQWCRCLATANLLNLGNVSELPFLNSFFENFYREQFQTDETIQWIRNAPLKIPTILVSHQVNIAALTGYSAASGEMVFVRRSTDGRFKVIGSIQTDK